MWLMTSNTGASQTGDSLYYLDPGNPGAVDYVVAAYAELVSRYDVDGIHLDRVRYPGRSWGYNPTALYRFQWQTGHSQVPSPDNASWLQWRRNQLTSLVRKIYLTVTAIDPKIRVSAALSVAGAAPRQGLAWHTRTPYTHHLQDWPAWLDEGILDLGLPMTYRDEDMLGADFDRWVEWEKDHQYGRATVIGTGLYLNSVEDSMGQWHRARQPSATGNQAVGISGYSYATPSDRSTTQRVFVNAVAAEVFTQTVLVPAIVWKDDPRMGHVMGTLTQNPPCLGLDGRTVSLTGPEPRTLTTDGDGWFGAVDLPPGQYRLEVDVPGSGTTVALPLTVSAGAVAEAVLSMPPCRPAEWRGYLPLVVKKASRQERH
jgi:uncharacterized lipoprotein YddW (UPF0748 family)